MLPPIVCISNMEWDSYIPTNRHQLMRRFAQRTDVAYVEAPLPVLGSLIGHSRFRTRHRGWRQDGDVHILQAWDWIPYPLIRRSESLSHHVDQQFRLRLAAEIRAMNWPAPVLWLYTPDGGDLLGMLGERMSVYHCVDDYDASAQYTGYRRTALYSEKKYEEHLVRSADLVIVTAPHLRQRWGSLNPHLHLLPNVADTTLFRQALHEGPLHAVLKGIPVPRVAYVGALDAYKVNYDLLMRVAQMLPHIHFVCVGPVGVGDRTTRDTLPDLPNLHYVGHLPQVEIPAILRGCQAAIIPYNLNNYTAGVSPLKLYEYLAAGCPVVATPLPSLQACAEEGLFLVGPDPEVFSRTLLQTLQMPAGERHRISDRAMGHSWEHRVDELEHLILERLDQR